MAAPVDQPESPFFNCVTEIERGIQRVAARFEELPITEATLFRVLVLLGRELSSLAELSLRRHGLNDTDLSTLMALYSQPDGVAHPGDLCISMGQSPANMTRVADALLERGLITRIASDADRRRMVLRMTPAGVALVQEYLPHAVTRVQSLFADLRPEERARLLQQLKNVCVQVDRLTQAQAPDI
jgi:MarR family transcriptional repressor of emrRAB